jgi:aryl-alcohol dehydrogenase-like predicted oxidoreductase
MENNGELFCVHAYNVHGDGGAEAMEKVRFGQTELEVSVLVLGTWVTGGWAWGGADDGESLKAILRALELDINFIDTAPVYGFGKSESIVGQALREWGKREGIVVATKCGLEWDEKERIRRNSSPSRIRQEVDQSLVRLGLDRIDLYQIHWPDSQTPFEASMEAMLKLQQAGKIHYIGLSNYDREQIMACQLAGQVSSLQPPYNLFEREAEKELLPYCETNGIATMAYGGLCRGLLAGKFTGEETFPRGDLRRADPKFKPDRFKQYVKAVEGLKKLAGKYHKSMAQFALRWVLQQPGITTVLAGARTASQVDDNVGVAGWQIQPEDLKNVETLLDARIKTPIGPEFMSPRKEE